jgi:hypothetical protein
MATLRWLCTRALVDLVPGHGASRATAFDDIRIQPAFIRLRLFRSVAQESGRGTHAPVGGWTRQLYVTTSGAALQIERSTFNGKEQLRALRDEMKLRMWHALVVTQSSSLMTRLASMAARRELVHPSLGSASGASTATSFAQRNNHIRPSQARQGAAR